MVKLVKHIKLPQDKLESFSRVLLDGGSKIFSVIVEWRDKKYPMFVYMTNHETIVNTLKNNIKYIDYYLDEIQSIIGGYLPMLHYIVCDGKANCVGVDYMLTKDLLELFSVSDKIGFLIGLKYIGANIEAELLFEDAFVEFLENSEETKNKAKEMLEKLKNVTDDDIDKAFIFYIERKSYDTRYLKFFKKIRTTLNVDTVNLIGVEPYIHPAFYYKKKMQE